MQPHISFSLYNYGKDLSSRVAYWPVICYHTLFSAIILLTNGWLSWSWKGSVLCQLSFSIQMHQGSKLKVPSR